MKDEITEFFGNLENITDFSISKWIHEQTNDLKPHLFCQLNKAFNRYCVDWLENKRNNQTKYDFPQVYNGQIRDFLTTPGLFETSIIADSAIKKDIVLNHYRFYENIIEFESQPQPMKGLFSVWDSVLYSEVYRFQNIMHKLFEEIKSKEPTAQPQQNEIVNPDEVKPKKELHNHIFRYNAFEIFEAYKEKREITVSSRTDLRVIFDLLKEDDLFIETVDLKHYIRWINKEYFTNSITELRVQNLSAKPNVIRANDYKEIKESTLKQP